MQIRTAVQTGFHHLRGISRQCHPRSL